MLTQLPASTRFDQYRTACVCNRRYTQTAENNGAAFVSVSNSGEITATTIAASQTQSYVPIQH